MKPSMLESTVYGYVDGLVLLSFNCSNLACGLFLCAEDLSEFCKCCGMFY
jgi:hypothetical protein